MPTRAATRRRFLATALTGAVAAAAGCLEGVQTGNDDGRRVLHLDLVHRDGLLRDQHVVDLSETGRPRDEEAFEAALDGDRYTTQYRKPFASNPAPTYAERDGTYYRPGSVVVDEVTESRLLAEDGPDQVTYRETRYAVEVTRETFHEPVHRATVEPVATSPERVEAILRAKLVDARIDPGELSTDARDVLRRARGDGYGESHPFSSGYRAVLIALHERAYLDGDVDNDALGPDAGRGTLRYDGEYYDYGLRFRSGAS